MMAMFRARPLEVDAIRWDGDNAAAIEKWLGDDNGGCVPYFGILRVAYTEGSLQLDLGDWLIRSRGGHYTRCEADEFARSFEPVGATP